MEFTKGIPIKLTRQGLLDLADNGYFRNGRWTPFNAGTRATVFATPHDLKGCVAIKLEGKSTPRYHRKTWWSPAED